MHAKLMGAARNWPQLNQAKAAVALQNLISRIGRLAVAPYPESLRPPGVTLNWHVYYGLRLFWHPAYHSYIFFFGFALGELFLQPAQRFWRFGADHNARGGAVQAVNYAGAFAVQTGYAAG